jgi:hypothetical protein
MNCEKVWFWKDATMAYFKVQEVGVTSPRLYTVVHSGVNNVEPSYSATRELEV